MSDRRDPKRQAPRPDGRRAEDPMSTGAVARKLGVSTAYVRKQIREGRLPAIKIQTGRKRMIRISPKDFQAFYDVYVAPM